MAQDQNSSQTDTNRQIQQVPNTNQLIQEMMKQMTALQKKLEAIRKNPASRDSNSRKKDSDNEMEDSSGRLVQLTETTKSFLEAAFSGTIFNEIAGSESRKLEFPTVIRSAAPSLMGS